MLPLLFASVLAAPPADVWPGYHGDGTSVSAAKNLPTTWSPTENVGWRAELPGYGQSSPVVWKGKVYVTAVEGPKKETLHVQCFDLATGKPAWAKAFPSTQPGPNNPMTSRAAPTPVADADGVVCFFESGDLIALTPDGRVRWQRSLSEEYGELKNNHGLAGSPVQTEKSVILLVDHNGPSYLLAVNKADGKNAWKEDRDPRGSWTSPVLTATADGKPAVLAASGDFVSAYDPATGKKLWELEAGARYTISSPGVGGGVAVLIAGENRDNPGADSNGNGLLKLGGAKGEFGWRAKRLVAGMGSPVIADGFVYFVDKAGIAHCLELTTGEEKYAERVDGSNWATPVVAGGHVYYFGKDGATVVTKAGPAFDAVATNRLWTAEEFARRKAEATKRAAKDLPFPPGGGGGGPYGAVGDVVYGAAAVDGAILLRAGSELVCVRAAK